MIAKKKNYSFCVRIAFLSPVEESSTLVERNRPSSIYQNSGMATRLSLSHKSQGRFRNKIIFQFSLKVS